MNERYKILRSKSAAILTAIMTAAGPGAIMVVPHRAAAQDARDLRQRIDAMEKQLTEQLKDEKQLKEQLKAMKAELEATKQKAETAQTQADQEDNADIKWHFGGVVYGNYTATNQTGVSNSFGDGTFAPIFLVDYRDLLQAEAHLEFTTTSTGETNTSLEYANLNLFATDWLTVTAGKFLSPIGDFQLHQHPAWINKLPDRPAGFTEDGGTEPLSEIGVALRGAVPIGSMTADYAVFVSNGPKLADSADGGVQLEGRTGDNNEDKAFGGRIGLRPLPYINIGVSGMRARIKGNAGAGGQVTSGDYDLEDVDAAFTKGNWNIRGEYIRAHLDSLMSATATTNTTELIPASTWRAWYAQASYRLAGITSNEILANFEPVVRYSQFHIGGLSDFQANAENRWTVGLDYWFAPSLVAKAAYESRDFKNQKDAQVFRAQLAFGF